MSLKLAARADSTTVEQSEIVNRYHQVFQGLGNFGEDYVIKIKDNARPYALFTPRNVPIPLREKVKLELDQMEQLGVISKVTIPTPWCAGMVVVPKPSRAVRICVDLKPLNECVIRETHPIPSVDNTLAQMAGATIFSKVDANSGFWQVPLAAESRHLTTFITPHGRFCFNKLPFGITSAPELFQRLMNKVLQGLDGVLCHMDDVLIFGSNQREHDERLEAVMKRLLQRGVTLNRSKCEFNKSSIKFLGYIIDKDGMRPDPRKLSAIVKMKAPTNITELRRFMGMTNQLGKFSSRLADISQPLRELLSTKRQWVWEAEQERAFSEIKAEFTRPAVLALYDPSASTKVSADASDYGLGAVLMQKKGATWKPVAYASRSMSDTEKRYAQIEKEALAVTWGCGRFSNYILGRSFILETDHKPLVPLLSTKHLDNLPPRILCFHLRMTPFDYSICHIPGKELYTADTLSRAPEEIGVCDLEQEAESFVQEMIQALPSSPKRLMEYKKAQAQDSLCSKVMEFCQTKWPESVSKNSQLYWKVRNSLSVKDQILLYNSRLVIPTSLQQDTLKRLHGGHQGIVRCRMRSASSVWWPGIAEQVNKFVLNCPVCSRDMERRQEPLISTPLPEYPWQTVGTDLFHLKGDNYLLVVDYFSRYPEVTKISSTTTGAVIAALKAMFSRNGIPENVRSDNGPQYSSEEFRKFSKTYGFEHKTSSPLFPQSNGMAERTVKTVKQLLHQAEDPCLALLCYRATPLPWCNLSPAELLFGRKIRTTLPQTLQHLRPKWETLKAFQEADKSFKQKQKIAYDKRHGVRKLPEIPEQSDVWITSGQSPVLGTVVSPARSPRSYIVNTPTGVVRRNRLHLGVIPPSHSTSSDQESDPSSTTPNQIMTRSRTGTSVHPPQRFEPGCP